MRRYSVIHYRAICAHSTEKYLADKRQKVGNPMKINYVNPVTNEKREISVTDKVPYTALSVVLENIVDSFPVEKQCEYGRALLSVVNSALKQNAVAEVANSDNIFAKMAERVTYGKYTINPNEDGTGYEMGNMSKVDKHVSVKNEDGKSVKDRRFAFVTYADCVRYARAVNIANKKDGLGEFVMRGNFNADEMRKLRYFIKSANGRLTEKEREILAERGESYAPFLMDKDSANGKKARVQVFYDIFNGRAGKSVNAIHHIENNVLKECNSYSSMYKLDKDASESVYITALFNEWLNSEMVMATAYRAKNPEKPIRKKSEKKNAEK